MTLSHGETIKAVIVDDEDLSRSVLAEYLDGHQDIEIVAQCANGFEAVQAVNNLTPDLLFLDIQMPKLDGFEVLELIGKDVGIIFVTAYDQYAVRAFEVHALDYLLKPFDQERFNTSWRRAKEQIMRERSGGTDQRILALLEELKAGNKYLERLVIKAAGRIYFLETTEIDWIEGREMGMQTLS